MEVLIEQFMVTMKARNFAHSTQVHYCYELNNFFLFLGDRDPLSASADDILRFQAFLVEKKLAPNTINCRVAAVKLFYWQTLRRPWPEDLIPWVRRKRRLPVLFSAEEVAAIINATRNLKQRTMFMAIYATGMRCCEVRHLRVQDIDSRRMQIRVQGKGNYPRLLPLSILLLHTLRKYWVESKNENKSKWLFPGGDSWEQPYCTTSMGRAFNTSKKKAGIEKPSGLHVLRHCYATHLLESGVDIRLIQLLLGHAQSSSTEIYTHLRNQFAQEIKSPLDAIANLLIKS